VAGLDEYRSGQNGPEDGNRVGLGPQGLLHPGDAEERLSQFQDRVQAALGALLDAPLPARLIVVVHSGVIDAVLRWARGASSTDPWTSDGVVGHASITELELHPPGLSPPRPRVIRVGDVSHLQEHLRTD
jgi:broad specificity phosphatase PhoE